MRQGIFGLRSLVIESAAVDSPEITNDENRRVRIPHFPSYIELRLLLPIWSGRRRSQITGLRATIATLRGSPQEPGDWTKPDRWIAERLQDKDRELAQAIWQKTDRQVNPRHIYGHWLFACTYKLLVEDNTGRMNLTQRGQDFIDRPLGDTESLVDEQEGILKILTIAAEKGTGQRSDFIPDWTDYLARYSRYGTDSTIKDTLSRRLQSILERGLLIKAGTIYSITG